MAQILIVEDSFSERMTLETYLEQSGLQVKSVTSAEAALVTLETFQPTAIVLDVVMPGKSGFELCRQLKSNPTTQKIPIVICSSKSTDADRLWGEVVGADAYVTKPIESAKQITNVVWKLIADRQTKK